MDANSQFQRVLELSKLMLEAGQNEEWERLIALENKRQQLLPNIPVKPADIHLVPLLQEIQQYDEELREKLEAWMKHAKILLREN